MAISDAGVIAIVIVCAGVAILLGAGVTMHMRDRPGEHTYTMNNDDQKRPSSEQKKYMDSLRRDSWRSSMSQVTPMKQAYHAYASDAGSQI